MNAELSICVAKIRIVLVFLSSAATAVFGIPWRLRNAAQNATFLFNSVEHQYSFIDYFWLNFWFIFRCFISPLPSISIIDFIESQQHCFCRCFIYWLRWRRHKSTNLWMISIESNPISLFSRTSMSRGSFCGDNWIVSKFIHKNCVEIFDCTDFLISFFFRSHLLSLVQYY